MDGELFVVRGCFLDHATLLPLALPDLDTPLPPPLSLQLGGGGPSDLRVRYVSTLLSAWTGLRRLDLMGKADMVRRVGGQ